MSAGERERGVRAFLPWRRGRRAALLSGAVFALTAGGIAWATIPGPGGVISGCYNKTTGALRVIDLAKDQHCAATETALRWNQKGQTGPRGPKGATGPQGPSRGFMAFSDNVPLTNGPTTTTVVTLNVPAGGFIVTAKLVPYIGRGSDSMRCDLVGTDGTSVLDQSYTTIVASTDSVGATMGEHTVSLLAPLYTFGGTISVACEDNQHGVMTMYSNRIAAMQLSHLTSTGSASVSRLSPRNGTSPKR